MKALGESVASCVTLHQRGPVARLGPTTKIERRMAQVCVAEIDDTGKSKCVRVDEAMLRAWIGVQRYRRCFDDL